MADGIGGCCPKGMKAGRDGRTPVFDGDMIDVPSCCGSTSAERGVDIGERAVETEGG